MKSIISAVTGICIVAGIANSGIADEGIKARQTVIGNPYDNQLAFFSPRLGARFVIQTVQIGNFPPARVARIVSRPEPGSPLTQIGLRQGDLITRLDGIPVSNLQELEKHILDTTVRFVRAGTHHLQESLVMIDPHLFFYDPVTGTDTAPLTP